MSKEKEVLQKLFGEDVVKTLESVEDVETFVGELTEKQRTKYLEIFENDTPETVKNKIIQSYDGKMHGTIDTKLKKYGISPDETKGLTPAQKLDKLQEKLDDLVKNASKKEVAEMQQELLTLNAKLQKYDEEIIPGIKSEVEKEKSNFYINNALAKEFANIDSSVLTVGKEGREMAFKMLDFHLKETYDIKNENGTIVFYQKGTDKKVTNEQNTEILSKEKIILNSLKNIGLYRQSNGGGGTPPNPSPTPTGGTGGANAALKQKLEAKLKA